MFCFAAWVCFSLHPSQGDPQTQARGLIERLGSEKYEVRVEAGRKLRELGDPAIVPLEEALKSADAEVRERAAEVIGRIRWGSRMSPRLEEAAGRVFRVLGSPDPAHRAEGVRQLARVISEIHSNDSQVFRWLLHDPSYRVAQEAYRHLSWRGADRMLIDGLISMVGTAALANAESDSGREIASIVDRLLDAMTSEDRPRLAPLLKAVDGPGKLCGRTLSFALGDKSPAEELKKDLEGAEWKARVTLQGFSRAPQAALAEGLRKLVAKKEAPEDLRALSVLALARLGERPDVDLLLRWAEGKDGAAAIPALRAIGVLRDEGAVKKILGNHKRGGGLHESRHAAVLEMVAELDKPGGYEALFECIKQDPFVAHPLRFHSRTVRIRILKALFPHWIASGVRDARLLSLRVEYEIGPSRELTELAVKVLGDSSRAREHGAASRVVFRPLTLEQEAVVKSYLVEQGKKDLSRIGFLNGRLQIALPELVPVARERLLLGGDPHSLKTLALWGDKSDIPRVRQKLDGADENLLSTLAKLGDREVADKLIERMRDPKTAQSAATQLEFIWSKDLAERLKGLLRDESYRHARWWVLHAFDSAGDRSLIPEYRAFLKDQDDTLRSWAARLAGEWRDEGARERLRELVQDPEMRVKVYALRSLALLGDATIEPEVLKLCASDDGYAVTVCIEALGALKTPAAIRMLVRLAHTEEDYKYGHTLTALVRCGAREGLGPARAVLDGGTAAGNNVDGALAAIQSLGEDSDSRLVYPLALEGKVEALRALDAVVHRSRYAAVKGRHVWKETLPMDKAAERVSHRYGVPVSLSDDARKALSFRNPAILWGDRDIYGAIELLTHPIMECAPLFDENGLRLVAVSEAVAYWTARRPK